MGKQQQQSKADKRAQTYSTQLIEEASPLRQSLLQQIMEAIRTGGSTGKIPLIQRSTENSQAATSQAMKDVESSLGGVDSTFGRQIMANTKMQGEQATAAIPSQVAEMLAGMGPNFALGMPQMGMQGLGQVGQNAASGGKGNQAAQMGGLAALIQAMAAAYTACWVAEVLWGVDAPKTLAARRYVSRTNNWFTRRYRERGIWWAERVQNSLVLRALAYPLWSWMAWRGK